MDNEIKKLVEHKEMSTKDRISNTFRNIRKINTKKIRSALSDKAKEGHTLLKGHYKDKSSLFYEWIIKQRKQLSNFKRELKGFLFATTPEEAHYRIEVAKTIKKQLHTPMRVGMVVISIGFSLFGIWGMIAPLDTASYAPGYIVPSGSSKAIQHLEGGMIKEILVKDGDYVLKDQPLIILDSKRALTENRVALSHLRICIAVEKRLTAEINNDDKIDFHDPMLDTKDKVVQTILKNQQMLFETKSKHYKKAIETLQKKEDSLRENVQAHHAVLKSYKEQLRLVEKGKKNTEILFAKKLITQNESIHVQTTLQDLLGRIDEVVAKISVAENEMYSLVAQKRATEQEQLYRIQDEYSKNHASLLEMRGKYEHTKDILERTVIRAPSEGTILNLAYHAPGGVIHPNVKIMDIIPKEEELIAEVKVSIRDIDNIHIGSDVKVSLEAYKARLVPRIDGKVIYISADKILSDRMTPNFQPEYYIAKIKIDRDMIAHLTTKVELYPGMPVNAFIIVGTRSFMQIMLSPIIDSFHKAFKEV